MNIGVINKREIPIGDGKTHKYLEMSVRPPFMESATFTISPNKKKENSEKVEPDFNIYYSYNRKGEKYRRVKVGAIWNKTSDDGIEYKSGNIQSPIFPNGILYFSIFTAKPLEGESPESITWTHDVIWSPQRPTEEQNRNNTETTQKQQLTEIDIDENEIPF